MPLVSVVMPVYNGADYLEAAVRSVLDQTMRDLELIVVDDGSGDDSLTVLERLSENDRRIRIEALGTNQGHHVASNRTLALAGGELIARHDQDDLLRPDWLRQATMYLAEHPEVGLLGGAYRLLEGDETGELRVPPERHTEIRTALVFKNVCCHPGIVLRSSWRETGVLEYRDFAGPQDYDLWVRLLDVTQGANLPLEAVLYRRHEVTMTGAFESEMPTDVERISDRQLEELLGPEVADRDLFRVLRRLWRAQNLEPDDLSHVDVMDEVFDALGRQPLIDRSVLEQVRRHWARRLVSRSVRTYRRPPWRLVRTHPVATAAWVFGDVPAGGLRRLRRPEAAQ